MLNRKRKFLLLSLILFVAILVVMVPIQGSIIRAPREMDPGHPLIRFHRESIHKTTLAKLSRAM